MPLYNLIAPARNALLCQQEMHYIHLSSNPQGQKFKESMSIIHLFWKKNGLIKAISFVLANNLAAWSQK